MKKRRLTGAIVVLALLVCVSCSDDSDDGVRPNPFPYKDLTKKEHVLFNLELAYNNRNLAEVQKLIDEDFAFWFSTEDFLEGDVPIRWWEREFELTSARGLFDPEHTPSGISPVSKIDLKLTYAEGENEWTAVAPDDTLLFAGETWYEKTFRYDLIVTSGPLEYRGLNTLASIRVRPSQMDDKTIWRIVSWRDGVGGSYAGAPEAGRPGAAAVKERTWGKLKMLFYDGPPVYRSLCGRDDVLSNLQTAYRNREFIRVYELLDDDLTFYFSAADIKEGKVPVEQWDRLPEIAATANLFDPQWSKPGVNPAESIDLTLTYTPGEDGWTPMAPDDPEKYPNETWYEKPVRYNLIVTSGSIDYIGLNMGASIVIRRTTVEGIGIWRLVSWRDDTESQLASSFARTAGGQAVEETTWGRIKYLYAD